jgi:plasmid replication initiation protein
MSVKKNNNKGIKLIKKSNELIEARYKFDIWETRIFTSVLSQIARDDEDFRVYRIYLRDVIKDFGINNGNAYDLLREAADSLMNKKFFLDYEGDGAERKKIYHIIRSVDYMTKLVDENKRSLNEYIDMSVDPDMKPFLIQLKEQFTTYDVRNIIKFKSSYTVRIYELLKQHETFGRRKLEVEYLKRVFDLDEEYPLFANFYQKVIEPAYRDINEYTDLTITTIEKLKDGKKISALMFKFHRKTDHVFDKKKKAVEKPLELPLYTNDTPIIPSQVAESNSIDVLFLKYQGRVVADFGVTPTIFIAELWGKTEVQIERAIRVTEEAKKKNELKNVAGFFMEALRKGFTNDSEEKKSRVQQSTSDKNRLKIAQSQAEEQRQQAIKQKIKVLTTADQGVTDRAIQSVIASKAGQFRLKTLGLILPTIEDFRNDHLLRDFVRDAIVAANSDFFKDLND